VFVSVCLFLCTVDKTMNPLVFYASCMSALLIAGFAVFLAEFAIPSLSDSPELDTLGQAFVIKFDEDYDSYAAKTELGEFSRLAILISLGDDFSGRIAIEGFKEGSIMVEARVFSFDPLADAERIGENIASGFALIFFDCTRFCLPGFQFLDCFRSQVDKILQEVYDIATNIPEYFGELFFPSA